MTKTIAIQGVEASFHDIAATQYFGADSRRVFCGTFADTFAALATGEVDFVLCAIENSLYGSINEVYDLLQTHDFHIIGEVYLRIEQCLIGLPTATIDGITEVHSHPVALAQCEHYLDETLPNVERMESHDTAESVAMIAALQDSAIAAIAGRQAAELHGMQILAEAIETDAENYTRFVVLSKSRSEQEKASKTSLILQTNHTPGALYHALGSFAKRGVNLTKLQSRRIIGKAWKYVFYVDLAVGVNDVTFTEALSELERQDCQVTILGSYEAAPSDVV
jgi:prephenate dehydratase